MITEQSQSTVSAPMAVVLLPTSDYMGVPDMAIGPLYYSLYDAVCVRMASEFPDGGITLKQNKPDAADPRRGRGHGPADDGGRRRYGVGPANRSFEERQVDPQPRRHDPARRRRADPQDDRAAAVHQWPTSVRLLQRREQLVSHG
jgi:hypothetical protein